MKGSEGSMGMVEKKEKGAVALIKNYLLKKLSDNDREIFSKNDVCFKKQLEETFECKMECSLYDQVVNGEGNEKDKIRTVYSSSLQSLLFFSPVDAGKKINLTIAGEKIVFSKVLFEYKNKVIGFPSSIDVVLADESEKHILFIESKLAEIARDSKKKTIKNNSPGTKEVGISYFGGDGYKKTFHVNEGDFKDFYEKLGIEKPEGEDSYFVEKTAGKGSIKAKIVPIDNNSYVYSYGIKQMLSHLIGIMNFINGERVSEGLSDDVLDSKIYFMEICNGFPGIGDEEIDNAQREYFEHVKKVEEILGEKCPQITMLHTTYQRLYELIKDSYTLDKKVVDFYHLDESGSKIDSNI